MAARGRRARKHARKELAKRRAEPWQDRLARRVGRWLKFVGVPEPLVKPIAWVLWLFVVVPVKVIDELLVKPVRWLLRSW